MSTRRSRRPLKPLPIGRADLGLWKLGIPRFDVTDPYHLAVSLPWPAFIIGMVLLWLVINVIFALLYVASPGDVANARPGSFSDVFFFSIETLATVGYGVMAPTTLYGHIVSAAEIVTGTAFTAIVTGLLFVRFSKARAKILFCDDAVITAHNGHSTLMLRLANGRNSIMTNASVRLYALISEQNAEGVFFRRVQELPLAQSQLPLLLMPWTLFHTINKASPLFGLDAESLTASGMRLFLTLEARDQALAAVVQDMRDYLPEHIRFGMRFVDSVTVDDRGHFIADLTRLSMIEPDTTA